MKVNSNLDFGNIAKAINVPTPTAAGDAVPKSYADALKAAMDWKDSARVASVANVNIASAPATIDGVALAPNDRILLKDQTAGAENDIYTFVATGSALVRATDADTNSEVTTGMTVPVSEGTVNADTVWMLTTNDPIVVATTALTFTQIGTIVNAGTGLTKNGNSLALIIPVAITSGGTGAITAAAARTNLGAITKYAADIGDNSSTSINVDHNLGTTDVQVAIYNKATGAEEEADVTPTTGNRVVLGFTTAPGTNALRVVVIG